MTIKHKFFILTAALLISGSLILTSCTSSGGFGCAQAISRGWATGTTYNGMIFIASKNGKLFALNAADNTTIGKSIPLTVPVAQGLFSCSPSSASLVTYASPVVINSADPGTVVYIGGTDGKVHGFLFSVKDNTLIEKNPTFLSAQLNGEIIGGLITDNNAIYFATADGTVYSLNPKDLSINWSHKIDSKIWSQPTLDGSTLYIGCFNKTVHALNTTDGSEKWQTKTDGSINSSPVIFDNKVFIGDYSRHFYAFEAATGKVVWQFPAADNAPVIPENWFWAKPVLLNGTIYAPCLDGNMYALDASTGKLVRQYNLGDSISSSPVVFGTDGNYLAVATSVASTDPKKQRGSVYIINTTDTSKLDSIMYAAAFPSFAIASDDIDAPLFAIGNVVYVHTTGDKLYSLNTAAKENLNMIKLSELK